MFTRFLVVLVLGAHPLLAAEKGMHFSSKRDGWHFYKPNPLPEEIKKEEEPSVPAPAPMTYKAQMDADREAFEEAKAKAILHPTAENVLSVQKLHRQITDRATDFSKMWMQVSLKTGTLTYPEANTNRLHREVRETQETAKLKNLFEKARDKSYGLFLLTREGCAYCVKFAPVVKQFAGEVGLEVLEIYEGSPTGILESVPENGLGRKLNEEGVYPMLFLVDVQKNYFHTIARGMEAPSGLLKNAGLVLTALEKEGLL